MSQCKRKRFLGYQTWIEKETNSHKHDFSVECILEEKDLDFNGNINIYQTTYSTVMVCSKCHSFTKSRDFVKDEFYTYDKDKNLENKKILEEKLKSIPKIIAYRNNRNFEINYKHIIFPDGYEYVKL